MQTASSGFVLTIVPTWYTTNGIHIVDTFREFLQNVENNANHHNNIIEPFCVSAHEHLSSACTQTIMVNGIVFVILQKVPIEYGQWTYFGK